jgi:hypothetical protein
MLFASQKGVNKNFILELQHEV